jgi:plasmid segregation protein ParM
MNSASIPMNSVKSATTPMDTKTSTNQIKSILSVDLGRTATKTCVSREPNNVVFIPANVKHLSMEQVRGGIFEARATDPLLDMWLEYQGSGYAVGQLAADFGANLGVGQSKTEDALAKVLSCAGYFNLKDDIAVVLGLPFHSQEQFEREKAQLVSLLSGPHIMNYRGESVSLNITKAWVMPEGYGSLLWCEAQSKKGPSPDFTKLSVAIVDIGHQTTDFLMVDSFRFARGASKSEAFAMSQFYEQVASNIEGADSQSLSLISAVNRPKGERFYRPRGATKPTNLDDILPNLKESFSREICSRLLAWLPERVTDVILTGGGGEFFWDDIQRLLKEAKINAHLAAPSRQANALGQYIYGEAQLAASTRAART